MQKEKSKKGVSLDKLVFKNGGGGLEVRSGSTTTSVEKPKKSPRPGRVKQVGGLEKTKIVELKLENRNRRGDQGEPKEEKICSGGSKAKGAELLGRNAGKERERGGGFRGKNS